MLIKCNSLIRVPSFITSVQSFHSPLQTNTTLNFDWQCPLSPHCTCIWSYCVCTIDFCVSCTQCKWSYCQWN